MTMKFKHFAIILALFCFSVSLFAEPVKYSFSSLGGGLPSSAARVSLAADSETTQQRIIIAEDDEDDDNDYNDRNYDYDYPDEPTVKKGKKTGLIITYVVVGVVVVAGIAVGAYYFTNESANCCATVSDNLMEGCAEGCGEECGRECGDACSQSASEACSASMNDACNSSTSSTECTTNILSGGFQLIPIYVP